MDEREQSEKGCVGLSCWINRELYNPAEKDYPGHQWKTCQTILLSFFSRRSFLFLFLLHPPSQSFWYHKIIFVHFVLFLHLSLVVFGHHFLSSFCLFWSLYQDPEMRNTKMKNFMMEWRWAFLPSVAHLTSSGSCISHHMGEMNSSTSDEESCGGLSA